MADILIKIVPVILIFILGYFLKYLKIFKKEDGDLFLKLVFYVAMPALILLSISKIDLRPDFIYLPIASVIVILVTSVISFWFGNLLKLSRATLGSFIVGTTIINMGFVTPFFIAAFGDEGLARSSLFEFGEALLCYTLIYYFACKFGTNSNDHKSMIKKFLISPPIWALLTALLINFTNLPIPAIVGSFLLLLGNLTVPLVMLSLGIYFNLKLVKIAPVLSGVFIRMGLGLAFGFILVNLFNFEGLSRLIVLIGSSAPIGYTTMTYSSMENLNKEFAASLVSFSILCGIVLVPILILLLS